MRFGTDGLRGRANQDITAPLAMKVGFAAVRVLGGRIAVAHDGRPSAGMLEAAVVAGITAMGGDAVRMGLLPTPGVSSLVAAEGFAGGIVLTASHNAPPDNGLKLLDGEGHKPAPEARERIESVLSTAFGALRFPEHVGRVVEDSRACERYASQLVERFSRPGERPLAGARIVLDLANGAGRSVGAQVLGQLGAEVELLGNAGGEHINERCGAVHPQLLARQVVASRADAGIALDGDGDRAALVAPDGRVLDGDALLWLGSAGLPSGSVVVGTVMTNMGLEEALVARGVRLVRAPVGDHHVAARMKDAQARLGAEPSGHVMWADGPPTSDGLYSALRALLPSPRSLRERAAGWTPHHQVHRTLRLSAATLPTLPSELIRALEERGARVIVRPSGTEPILRMMVEHADPAVATAGAGELVLAIGRILG